MKARSLVGYVLTIIVILFVGSLLLGQLLGQPILLSYVETGSMAPTMEPGDGFIAIPIELAGPIETGDVIVFQAETLHGGGLTTHRVVGETERGYITKGDANPVTDQAGAEPPVSRDQIVAVALQVGGGVVVIPNLGLVVQAPNIVISGIQQQLAILLGTRAVLGTQGIAYILFALGLLGYVASVVVAAKEDRKKQRHKNRRTGKLDPRLVIVISVLLLMAIVTGSMVVPSGTQSFEIVSSQSDAPGPSVIPTGESENLTYIVPSNGMIPVVVYLSPATDNVNVTPERMYIGSSGSKNATITFTAPPRTGSFTLAFTEHRYIAFLPVPVIDFLYHLHPWLPIVVIDLLIGIAFTGVAATIVGLRTLRVDSRTDHISWRVRLRRWLR